MVGAAILEQAKQEGWTDGEVVRRVLAGETPLYEILMRRYNQRLYRVARAILRDDAEAEDVMQDAYVRAYQHLADFEGRAQFSTWLARIAVHEALARSRRRARFEPLQNPAGSEGGVMNLLASGERDPEQQVCDLELKGLLERAILELPEDYRLVFVLREVEEMDTAETAESLGLSPENVKVRLHRARAMLRKQLYAQAGAKTVQAFQLHAARCDRVVREVFRTLAIAEQGRAAMGIQPQPQEDVL